MKNIPAVLNYYVLPFFLVTHSIIVSLFGAKKHLFFVTNCRHAVDDEGLQVVCFEVSGVTCQSGWKTLM